MVTTLSAESANWILPSQPTTIASTIPNYDETLPIRVNQDGIENYIKNRGTLNIGKWETEGRRIPEGPFTEPRVERRNYNEAPPPKVVGYEAMQNYTRSRSSVPNLIGGNLDPPNPHHQARVKQEGRENYDRNQATQMRAMFQNYGKTPLPPPRAPNTVGELATNNFYAQQKGHMGRLFTNYGHFELSPRPMPNVKGDAATMNMQRALGTSVMLQHTASYRPAAREPNVLGMQAHGNYEAAQGRSVNKLFHEYGKLPLSARAPPKVTYGGVDNQVRAQGDAVRKIITQCPPTHRYIERPQSALVYR